MESIGLWIERISALRRNLMRAVATSSDLQLVHVEILQYLSICNKYSDTAQALSRYLGQTKGTISQSLDILEARKLIRRTKDTSDKRVFHIELTVAGKKLSKQIEGKTQVKSSSDVSKLDSLEALLQQLQMQNGFEGFGICANCKFNKKIDQRSFQCGLTGEKLAISESMKICNEYVNTK